VVLPTGATVLNADDPLVAEMGAACKGAVILFTTDPANPQVAAHLAAGGRAVWLRHGEIHLVTGDTEHPLARLADLSQPGGGELFPENVLAAVAAAWAHGLSPADLANTLQATLPTTTASAPQH
jgi:cyanophycin synthetase